jgi:anti-anti-sigma regulatory factor
MDSAGIGELVACYKRAKEKGARSSSSTPPARCWTSSR